MEKVSVIVPVYNGENCIKRCADSILNQDYPELEIAPGKSCGRLPLRTTG